MNPIYRHSFVNAFLANGAISHITGNINGNSVVICSHFSIFETLETTDYQQQSNIHIVT